MRNFWTELFIDGRKTAVKTGPRGKDGGMTIDLYVNHEGVSTKAVTINCVSHRDFSDDLRVDVIPGTGLDIETMNTGEVFIRANVTQKDKV